ncbi:sigma-70 family RNA polymerase sigma factor [Mucilaginibacter sabulilitoris]|uniref:Sigma-70 family RNA polymerase sigma factor n=1 Tax=Mucilaginibacter sabulilitoris TaxID=1173583 RepID=A0ABZ0TJ86_9SPHI|nr:sigma-70 family RNA polymerase sigma factor [Mucilaginibacter sabulilitoris]WPU92736.1 sigma-70 family RNA polymerase sigma factor [Mucilaginibacter sabulilitoris]
MLTSKASVKDEELIVLLKQGKAYAFDLLYERYWKGLYAVAYNRTGEEEVAKDLVQNLLIDIWKRHDTLQVIDSLQQFLFGAIKLQILNYYRSENIKQKAIERALERMHNLFASMDELSSYYNLEKVVEEEVLRMPDNMKYSFLLRSDNRSVKEIADNLNLAEQTVSNNITKALKRLRKRLVLEYPDRHLTCIALLFYLLNN